MSNAVMMERTGLAMPGLGVPGLSTPSMGAPAGMPVSPNYLMVPRCTIKLEKCSNGMKLHCICEDKMSASVVQNLCSMLASGMCSCCCILNGMVVNVCNLTMGQCRCEMTENGVCITCTSGDQNCCQMIQACCDCLQCLYEAGCNCCVLLNNTPVCCGCPETKGSAKANPAKR